MYEERHKARNTDQREKMSGDEEGRKEGVILLLHITPLRNRGLSGVVTGGIDEGVFLFYRLKYKVLHL